MTKLRNTHFIGRIIRRFGTVTRYFKDKGYGFIRGDNGKSYFIHNSKLNGEYIERDYYVFSDHSIAIRESVQKLYLLSSLQKGVSDVKERIFRQGS